MIVRVVSGDGTCLAFTVFGTAVRPPAAAIPNALEGSVLRAPTLDLHHLAPMSCMLPITHLTGLVALLAVADLRAQIPDGYFVWGSQRGAAGRYGIYYSHPRDPMQPVGQISNLPADLEYEPSVRGGCASVLYRPSDGALIAGERAPAGHSVDLHVIHLVGDRVARSSSVSVGTSVGVGEIVQSALLPDGRVVVGASDLMAGGALAQVHTARYNWAGIGIVDTERGDVTPIPITNLAQVPGVVNGIALSADAATVYFCDWESNDLGSLWSVPIGGGLATKLVTLQGGPSTLWRDNDGAIVMPTLNGTALPNLYRYDPHSTALTSIPTTSGALNCMTIERVTGNYAVWTREHGTPGLTLFLVTPNGTETQLSAPGHATPNGIDVNPNPEVVTAIDPRGVHTWELAPNPGGIPLLGNAGFSLTLSRSDPTATFGAAMLGLSRSTLPVDVLGATLHIDPAVSVTWNFTILGSTTLALPIPTQNALRGVEFYVQTVQAEGLTALSSSPCVLFTVL